jgi:hypothetical protein
MNKFGELKTKMLTKLTESYTKENKTEVKDILKTIKENKNFKEMYLFYEEIENKYIEDKETAKLYVEGVSVMLNQESNDLSTFCESLNKKLGDIEITKNELYESLDQLMVKDSLSNIENKVIAKKKLVNHLTTKKEVNESKQSVYSQNENLLHAVLANNFNVLYSNTLSESQQEELKTILSIPNEELDSMTIELKESIRNQVNSLLNEAVADDEMSSKLNKVKSEVEEMKTSRYNYYRLTELKNGLN